MDKKTIIVVCVTAILVGGGTFYSGMRYAQNKTSARSSQGNFQDLRNLSPEERQARLQQMGGAQRGLRGNGDLSAGEIIAKDDTSVTIKLRDGGSKIVFISDTTEIAKSANGTKDDLLVGTAITAIGAQNQDGSISARSIQIRPALPRPQQ